MTKNSATSMLKTMDALNNQKEKKCVYQALLEKDEAFYFSFLKYSNAVLHSVLGIHCLTM